ncbi:MAG: hypothetical protein Q7V31_12150 [Parvibaculum sp.]|nr:hypothetical protein [Parvibaculum sp.]MDO8839669.1 hypothetical protein [Parvibaculum sp.]
MNDAAHLPRHLRDMLEEADELVAAGERVPADVLAALAHEGIDISNIS